MTNVNQLVDIYEIQCLKARYFRFVDLRQWSDLREVFTSDFEFDMEDSPFPRSSAPAAIVGADAFVAFMAASSPDRVTVHHGHMPEITLTGDGTATGIWSMYDYIDDHAAGRALRGYGHYHEQYLRGDDGQWRIQSMRLTRLRVVEVPLETHAGASLPADRLGAARDLDLRGQSE